MLTAEQIAPMRAFPMLRSTYAELGRLGVFEGRRVQLLYGTVVDMGSMGTPHSEAMRVLTRYFVRNAPDELDVMCQLPIAASDLSEPEPDFAFVPRFVAPAEDHPATALLVVEVADSSRRMDLGLKARLYAETTVPEYWVIDLRSRVTVVHRTPRRGKYANVRSAPWSTVVTSKSVPAISVRFSELFAR